MSTNQQASIRYRIINRCLTNKFRKYPSKEDLIQACEEKDLRVSLRTIENDLKEMRENEELGFLAPIAFDRIQKGYYYTDPEYTIDKIPLKNDDINALVFATEVLDQYKNAGIFDEFKGTVDKLIENFKVKRALYEKPSVKGMVILDAYENVPGAQFISQIIQALQSQQKVSFKYQKYQDEDLKLYELSPYVLKEFDGIWYLVGNLGNELNIKTFGLDRVRELEILNEKFESHVEFDRNLYFNNVYGVTHNAQKLEKVVIESNAIFTERLRALPLHKSQKEIIQKGEKTTFEYEFLINNELITKLLSLTWGCRVIAPKSLKDKIKNELKKSLEAYD